MSSIEQGSKYHVYLDSINRIEGTSSNFSYNISFPREYSFNKVVVLNCTIPKTYYLIQDNYNTFILRELGVDKIIYIPLGNYTYSSWVATITNSLNANSPNTWVYSLIYPQSNTPDTGKMTYTVTGNTGQPSFIFFQENSVAEQFGFELGSTNTFNSNSLTSKNIIKLQAEDRLFISSSMVVAKNNMTILQEVNCSSSPSYSTIVYQCTAPEFYAKDLNSDKSSTYTFSLTDVHGQNIDLNGLSISMTLLFYKENDIWTRLKNFMKVILLKLNL